MDRSRAGKGGHDHGAIAIGAVAGVVLTAPAILLALLSSGAGHGAYVAARLLFPVPMLLTRLEGAIGPITLAAGLLQFPLYGALVGRAVARNARRAVALVATLHTLAALACFSGLLPAFS